MGETKDFFHRHLGMNYCNFFWFLGIYNGYCNRAKGVIGYCNYTINICGYKSCILLVMDGRSKLGILFVGYESLKVGYLQTQIFEWVFAPVFFCWV